MCERCGDVVFYAYDDAGNIMKAVMSDNSIPASAKGSAIDVRIWYYHALQTINYADATFDNVMSHDFAADIFYGGEEGVFHETLEALEARAEQMRANSTCYAIVGTVSREEAILMVKECR